jgi:hypothetical protein
MRCPSCALDNPEGMHVCGRCGTPQRRVPVPEVLQGRAHDHAACLRVGKSLRVRRRVDAGGGIRLGVSLPFKSTRSTSHMQGGNTESLC